MLTSKSPPSPPVPLPPWPPDAPTPDDELADVDVVSSSGAVRRLVGGGAACAGAGRDRGAGRSGDDEGKGKAAAALHAETSGTWRDATEKGWEHRTV